MNYITFDILGRDKKSLETEIPFYVATARYKCFQLIKLNLIKESGLRTENHLIRILSEMKRKGLIDVFVCERELTEGRTAATYLLNKFPFLANEKNNETQASFFVKI